MTALACLAVLGFWMRASVLEQHAQRVSDDPFKVTRPDLAAEAERRLSSAARANPDHRPALARGQLLNRAGQERRAIGVLRDLVRAEPESVEAWAQLAVAARRIDPGLSRSARARALELNPLIAD